MADAARIVFAECNERRTEPAHVRPSLWRRRRLLCFGGHEEHESFFLRFPRCFPRKKQRVISSMMLQIIDNFSTLIGGARGIRTADLLNAIQALSQLSYGPDRVRFGMPHRFFR